MIQKIVTTIKSLLNDQRCIFSLAVGVLMLPTVVLCFTDPIPVLGWAAFVFFPLGFYLLALSILRKPGYALLFFTPLLLIAGTQLVLLWLFGGSVISVDMFLNFFVADPSETGELMSTIWPLVLVSCVIYLPFIALAIRSIRSKRELPSRFIKRVWLAGVLCGAIGSVSYGLSKHADPSYGIDTDIYPVNVIENIRFAVVKLWKSYTYPQQVEGFTFEAQKKTDPSRREIYLLVIGETSRAASWSAYGYERETTPLLSNRGDVLFMGNVFTQANITHRSVPIILSNASAEKYEVIYKERSLITAFKEAGFKTCYLSNQASDKSFIDYFASEADTLIRIRQAGVNTMDGDLLPYLHRFLDETSGNVCVVMHTYGSHFEYNMRYTKDFARYLPDESKRISLQHRENYRNAYDNSILYTDWFLNEAISLLDSHAACSGMVYISDHGEDIMDDERGQFLHCSPIPSGYQLQVPCLYWFSQGYRTAFPEKVLAAAAHIRYPFSSNTVFHSFVDMGDIRTPYLKRELSVLNNAFSPELPAFIDDKDRPILLRNMPFKEQDIRFFRERALRY